MLKRSLSIVGVFIVLLALAACSNKKVSNPIAAVDSKQPDKILFDRAMDAMKAGKYDVARLTLQTLINTYPDSEYVARAKLAVGDSWYDEGGSTAMTQAENEYKDFITFFPNLPEAAEAQLKIANIHFREMEKPDRDFTHAMRAEEEYRYLITTFPDSKLVPEAKQRLLEVQEVLAEREFRIGRFYYMKESYNASIARLRSVVETYPLYSRADEALYLLGTCYQREADKFRLAAVGPNFPEVAKGRMIKDREDRAAAAFSRIITEYPATDFAPTAKKALLAMHRQVPVPTKEEIARSRALEDSRSSPSYLEMMKGYIRRGPDVSEAPKGAGFEPTLVDPPTPSAVAQFQEINRETVEAVAIAKGGGGSEKISVDTGGGAPPLPNDAPPRSEAPATAPVSDSGASDPNGIPELKPVAPDNAGQTQNASPPPQLNEADNAAGGTSSSSSSANASSAPAAQNGQAADDYSSSKKKKKKGLHKLIPF